MSAATVPDLMGMPSQQIAPSPMGVLYRLWSFGDRTITRDADRVERCINSELGWRCGITTLCQACGRRAAIRERRRIQADTLGTTYLRAIITRTVKVATILEGHRVLVPARQAHNRSAAWRKLVLFARGRIEAKRTRDDDGWLVHAHEIALLHHDATTSIKALCARWMTLVGREGCVGSFDLRIIDEGTAARSGGTFRSARLLREQTEAERAGGAERRRAPRVGARHARAALGTSIRKANDDVIATTRTRTT